MPSTSGYPRHVSTSVRISAYGCAIAFAATIAGPATVGAAVANAGLLGDLGPDINVVGIDVSGKQGESHVGAVGRNARLAAVSTAPSTRQVVIRATPAVAQAEPDVTEASFGSPSATPAVALSGPSGSDFAAAPVAPVPMSRMPAPAPTAPAITMPKPVALPATSTVAPGSGPVREFAPSERLAPKGPIPATFRVGYAKYLRAADTTDLVFAALPGTAGIAGFVLVGAFVGYRQARTLQRILLAPVPTGFLL